MGNRLDLMLETVDGLKRAYTEDGTCKIRINIYDKDGSRAVVGGKCVSYEYAVKTYKAWVEAGYLAPTLWIDGSRVLGF